MRALSIMYHDIVDQGDWDASGFSGKSPAAYKLEFQEFVRHLDAIRAVNPDASIAKPGWPESLPLFFTFDDGGASSLRAAELLEARGWRGHFFITTDWIGRAAFLSAEGIRELRDRGHQVGSHSCSHPTRMARCSPGQMQQEWTRSKQVLEQILGEPVEIASVPGGYYSKTVGDTAERAGYRVLFNSEPTTSVHIVRKCLVLGRYIVKNDTPASDAAGLAAGDWAPRFRQSLMWQAKKVIKAVAGDAYLRIRERRLNRR